MSKGGKGKDFMGGGGMKGKFMGKGTGIVRQFDSERGFGFIRPDPDKFTGQVGPDLFCHVRRLPTTMACPRCAKVHLIKTKMPHNAPLQGPQGIPELGIVKGGMVRFGIEMSPDGKMMATDVKGWGSNPGICMAADAPEGAIFDAKAIEKGRIPLQILEKVFGASAAMEADKHQVKTDDVPEQHRPLRDSWVEAMKAKNYQKADTLRNQLRSKGIEPNEAWFRMRDGVISAGSPLEAFRALAAQQKSQGRLPMGAPGHAPAIKGKGAGKPPGVAAGWDDPKPADKDKPAEDMGTFECDACKKQFQAKPGTLVNCPGCSAQIQL